MPFLWTIGILVSASVPWPPPIPGLEEAPRTAEVAPVAIEIDQGGLSASLPDLVGVRIIDISGPATAPEPIVDILPPCCQARRRKPPTETVDVLPPRLRSMEETAEVVIPAFQKVTAEANQTVEPAAKQPLDVYFDATAELEKIEPAMLQAPDVDTSPCCRNSRRTEEVDVTPPQLKSRKEAAEEKEPTELPRVVAVSRQKTPPVVAEDDGLEVPAPLQPERRRSVEVASAASSDWEGSPKPLLALGLMATFALGFSLTALRRRRLADIPTRSVDMSPWLDCRPQKEEARTEVFLKRRSRALDKAMLEPV